jgi:V/A-type H+-transporting ATPase subunit D
MAVSNVAPTKTNLLKLKEELDFARLGHELLDQKRNILINELLSLIDQTVDYQHRVEEALREAFYSLEGAAATMGRLHLDFIAAGMNAEADVTIRTRRVMGVTLPVVDTTIREKLPAHSARSTTFWLDSALAGFREVLELIGRLAELKISVLRLAGEVKKTIRKVNALEKIAIPNLRETVSYIQSALEEYERDSFTLMKMIKERLEQKKEKNGDTGHTGGRKAD